jgi:hypothetical protein
MFYSLKTTSGYVNNLQAKQARTGNCWRPPIGHCRNYPVKLSIGDVVYITNFNRNAKYELSRQRRVVKTTYVCFIVD